MKQKTRRLRLTEQDWLKLRDFNKQIAKRIQMRLPSDWYLTLDEIEGAVYDTFLRYLNNYKEGAMSPTSYCYQYGELATYRDLMREYRQMKNQDPLDCLYNEDNDDDEPCRRRYGTGDVPALTTDDRSKQELKDEVQTILNQASPEDRKAMEAIMNGGTLRNAGKEIGLSDVAVLKRLRAYRKTREPNPSPAR